MRVFQVRYKFKGEDFWHYTDVNVFPGEDILKKCYKIIFDRFGFFQEANVTQEYYSE